ncbi:MAG TPA: substrate-binding domain-containing protein [Burkholderiales bacterium]|nr:substrate-binding domain-containing protein [Burkholderiales bacterium]
MRFRSIAVAAACMFAQSAHAADIRVYSGGAPQEVLRLLAPEFEKQSGHSVAFTFALVTEIQRKLAAGESADVVLLPEPLLAATEKNVPMRSDGRSTVARVGIALIARPDGKRPDISTADAVRKTLLDARRIALPQASVPSGRHLMHTFAELGIAEAINPKLLFKAAIDGGAGLVATGEADVGLYLISEVRKAKDVVVVGLLPPPFQSFVVYGAALPLNSTVPDAGLAFVRFISDPAQRQRWADAGFELVSGGR